MVPAPQSDDDWCNHPNKGTPIDDALALLQHRYRRDIIEYCSTTDDIITELYDLVDYIKDKRCLPDEKHEIAMDLHHIHLPQLARANLIEWNRRTGQIKYHPDAQLEQWLQCIRECNELTTQTATEYEDIDQRR